MSRSFSVFAAAAFFVAVTGVAFAQQPVSPVTASPAMDSSLGAKKEEFVPSKTQAVPLRDQQSSLTRTNALYQKHALERNEWAVWKDAPAGVKSFLSLRDPHAATALSNSDTVYFRVYDLDGDQKDDLILRYGTRYMCTDSTGCPNVVYYADQGKRRVIYKARKFLPATGGVFLNNIFYAILPKGGENFTAISQRMLFIHDAFGVETTQAIKRAMRKEFPAFYEAQGGEVPDFFYAKYDLNNDGKKEILVVAMQDDEGLVNVCNDKGACPILIYSPYEKDKSLRLLGHFYCFQDLVAARTSPTGYADLITHLDDVQKDLTVVFSMNPDTGRYERTQ